MRWPIQYQLLLPTLSVVVLAIVLTSGVNAYFSGARARQGQEEGLRRVVAALAKAPYPLGESVLQQVKGLSGADFVLLDQRESVQAGTVTLDDGELLRLQQIPAKTYSARQTNAIASSPTVQLAERDYLVQRVAVTLRDPASPEGSLVVLYPKELWWAAAREATYPAIIAGAVAVAAVVLVTSFLAHHFVQPIHHLRQRAAAIAEGDFQPVNIPTRNDEIRDLAISINQMTERLGQYERQVRRNEQLRTLDQLGAGMAHQLRNAATGGRMAIELHQRECDGGRANESLDVALRQLRLMESYLQRFLAVGRAQPMTPETISLQDVVSGAIALVQPTCAHAGVELVYRKASHSFWVRGDAEALRQLILNLVVNGIEAIGEQRAGRHRCESSADPRLEEIEPPSRIVLELEPRGEDRVVLRVCDSGPGPAAKDAERLFEPFVTSKAEGTGLGLYVARQVAEAHQGSIDWQRRNGETCFSIVLPLLSRTPVTSDFCSRLPNHSPLTTHH